MKEKLKHQFRQCRLCGKTIGVIEWGVYRKVTVDAEAVEVVPDRNGEEFVRIDGSKVRGKEAEPGTVGAEYVYRPHRKSCGVIG